LIPRRKTRKVIVGDKSHGYVGIGGDAPVALQTMTSTYTYDIDATVRQINDLHKAGADMVRVAVPDKRDTLALKEILNQEPTARVVMCSALGQEAKVLEAIKAGAKDFVVKPFQPDRVLDAIGKALS